MLVLLFANTVIAADQFTINGKVDSVSSGNAVLSYRTFTGNQFKEQEYTSEIKEGHFLFKGELNESINAVLKIGEIRITLYIEPAKMELYVPKTRPDKFVLKGSKVQQDEEQFLLDSKDLYDVDLRIYEQAEKTNQQVKTTPETDLNYKKLVEEHKKLLSQHDSVFALLVKKRITYIKSHPNSFQPVVDKSIIYLLTFKAITADSARILFNNLAENVRVGTAGRETDLFIKTKEDKNIHIGKMAPDFNTPDVNGKMIRLSDFREKSYVLLDFWASWCVPCVKGIPHMKALYTKYHDKGFDIISITKDDSRQDWLSALKKHAITHWYQVATVQDLEKASQGYIDSENISYKYPTNSIPQYILIDKTGKIIAKWEGYSEENEKDQDRAMKDIFGE